MVDKFQKILESIRSEKGEVTFLGIFKMDEFTDKWSLLLSAEWITNEKRDDFFKYFTALIRKTLNEDEAKSIARVGLFPTDEHLIDLLLNYKTGTRIQEQTVNGNVIHDGYVLASNRNLEPHIVPLSVVG